MEQAERKKTLKQTLLQTLGTTDYKGFDVE
jgi:hypothetical protein